MQPSHRPLRLHWFIGALILLFLLDSNSSVDCLAAGVTIITHGYDGNVNGWITAMANEIPQYFRNRYPGLNPQCNIYTITLTVEGGKYYYGVTSDSNNSQFDITTGEIIVKLDWSEMAGNPDLLSGVADASTSTVAEKAAAVLLKADAIADLSGHSLVELPIHLIGHSRGGSLMNELSRQLGTNGIWVDHLTTLDPHPFNNDGNFDLLFPDDASAHDTWENVLFHDNYWQDLGTILNSDPDGEQVNGAYNRRLDHLSEGYSTYHSNVHLWYYGTIDWNIPATYDYANDAVTINYSMRTNWWTNYEQEGTRTGFYYSLIGGGDRLSLDQPLGVGFDAISIGYNQKWDFGAGVSSNRMALTTNNGTYPNIIKFNITGETLVTQGNAVVTELFYQYAGQSTVTLQIYFDKDLNPYNTNSLSVDGYPLTTTGAESVYYYQNINLDTRNIPPGTYAIYGRISDGVHTRYLYTPEIVTIVQPPMLSIRKMDLLQNIIVIKGVPGQRTVIQTSTDLQTWGSLATNSLPSATWTNTINPLASSRRERFYRAMVGQ
jgi:hypothetical protein